MDRQRHRGESHAQSRGADLRLQSSLCSDSETARRHQSQERGPKSHGKSHGRTAAMSSLGLVPPGAPTPVTALPPALQNGFHTLAPASWVTPATPSPAGVRLVEPGSHDGTLAARVAAGGRLASVGEEGRCKVTRGNSPDGGGGSRGTGLAMDWCAGALRSRGGGLCLVRGPAAQCQLSTAVKGTPRPATGAPTSSSFICPFAHSRGG